MKNIHKNHRERLRKRFLAEGIDSFAPHEILELLLFYAIPQQDTNPISHELINKFGSLSAVMDANIEDLVKISGISEYSAALLKLIPKAGTMYNLDKIDSGQTFEDIEKIGEYCVYRYFGETKEVLSVMMLDNNLRMLGFEFLERGSQSGVSVNPERLGELLFRYNASLFVLVHNHPSGLLEPSKEDAEITQVISSIMSPFNKVLLEHILVVDNEYLPLMKYLRQKGYYFYES